MEAKIARSLQLSPWISSENRLPKSNGSLSFSKCQTKHQRSQMLISCDFQPIKAKSWHRPCLLTASCSSQNSQAFIMESENSLPSHDEVQVLKSKSEEIEPYLSGRCIYLVGMMGSGKTTVGKIIAEALGYTFFDCDTLIEQAVGGTSVAEIFKLHGEGFFRDNETEVLRKLSLMREVVVSTGGGAVVRPINWRYMHKGISVWLDVPVDALARRISTVGTHSRPLLHNESGDIYAKTLKRLSTLLDEREDAYANAKARVCLENIAAKNGCIDLCTITPTEIAIEALVQIENLLKKESREVH
ncbi:shikimate kinase, chloroplastic-like isoform X1 [Ipomoea triloba]|uniref:shikimate kinase, chloroplastic-like isoform X1 n=1 Tax=Ipomoea triloba TaxID=35885 RepID=UPI00125D35E6|nr:shikimate kinase, chloroplastic-like isoform X1 [Ipomoea triloba]XP_031091521.1 shikimate kinase, chloroplastic-like isoform X1 [Ipomoea triloba]